MKLYVVSLYVRVEILDELPMKEELDINDVEKLLADRIDAIDRANPRLVVSILDMHTDNDDFFTTQELKA